MRSNMAAKYILLLHVFVVFPSFVTLSEALPSGAPTGACTGAQPIHMAVLPLSSNNPYSFTVAVNEYVPGETLQVTISEASGGVVNGFFLQGRRTDTDVAVGTFMGPLPAGAQFRECTNAADSVTHTNADGKTGLTFTWRAPIAGTGEVQFVGAVAIDHDNFYGGIMSAMLQEANLMIQAQLPEPNVEVGSAAYFSCSGPDNTRWYNQQASGVDKEILSSDRITVSHVISEGVTYANLTIGEVVKNDSGIYVCKDVNGNSFYVQLMVYEVRDVVISPDEPEFVEGENLLLKCTVDGTTDQTVTWSVDKDGTPEPLTGGDDTSHVQVYNNGSLIVRTLTPEDAGVYICTHEFDEASKSAMVNVRAFKLSSGFGILLLATIISMLQIFV